MQENLRIIATFQILRNLHLQWFLKLAGRHEKNTKDTDSEEFGQAAPNAQNLKVYPNCSNSVESACPVIFKLAGRLDKPLKMQIPSNLTKRHQMQVIAVLRILRNLLVQCLFKLAGQLEKPAKMHIL